MTQFVWQRSPKFSEAPAYLKVHCCIKLPSPNIAYMSGWCSATKGRCGGCFPSFIFSVKKTGPRAGQLQLRLAANLPSPLPDSAQRHTSTMRRQQIIVLELVKGNLLLARMISIYRVSQKKVWSQKLIVFHELLSQGCINFKNLCVHHQEEVLRFPKHPQLTKFAWFYAKLWQFQKSNILTSNL